MSFLFECGGPEGYFGTNGGLVSASVFSIDRDPDQVVFRQQTVGSVLKLHESKFPDLQLKQI